ncbi:hypothetical protein CsSME_00006650 [Camellia sinensis var. sinensis]
MGVHVVSSADLGSGSDGGGQVIPEPVQKKTWASVVTSNQKASVKLSFMQLDLGQLQVRNEFSWHGCPEKDPSVVHLDVLDTETRNAIGLVAPAIVAGLGALTYTLDTLVLVIGASGFATAAATTTIGTVVGSFR